MQKRRNSVVKSLIAGALLLTVSSATAQEQRVDNWKPIFEKEVRTQGQRVIIPSKYRIFRVADDLKSILFSAPHETTVSLQTSPVIIDLPMPDGSLQKFRVVEAPVMEAELANQFPDIKTFSVVGVDQPGTYGKLDWTEFGFHGMLFASGERIFIDPYCRNNTEDYISYYTSDFSKDQSQRMIPECGATDIGDDATQRLASPPPSVLANIWAGTTLRTYRLAIACTGEYAQAATGLPNPTDPQILAVVTTSINRVDGVYETEAAIRMVLVANEAAILWGTGASDPFNGNNNAGTLITESQTQITNIIGAANFDIGHTFSTGGGGLAGLGVVCTNGQKARGITGSPNPVGDPYDIDYVAHEIGHQFSGNHSYNQCTGNATQNAGTMVEPGGGVTIMGYAGICAAADNIAMNSIAYFHTISFDEIMTFSNTGNGNVCPVKPSTGNNIPVVTGSANYTIPRMTPFTLTGSATDADGDPLTYSWEQFDNNSTNHAVGTASPYFRSLVPSTSPSRTFPRMTTVLTGATSNLGEYLPNTAQTLNFRLTARDNRMGGGGVRYAASQVTIAASGPFTIATPNTTGITWASSSTQNVTWNVNSTNTAPVSCANVRLLLSTDGGATYPTVILASTPNDGTQSITVPPQATTINTCRIKAEAIGNIFFDVNDNNFTITASAAPIASVSIALTTGSNPMCPGANAVFTATPFNGGTAPTYQWQVNGSNVGTGATYATTTLTNGQTVTCIMTSNLPGVVGSPATSNIITMTVGSTVPSVVIAGPSVLCAGATATYTATPTNGGSLPTYQWQVNGTNAGTAATFASSTLTNGQAVTCIMTSNAGCQATPTVTSNTITVTVNSSAALPFSENFEGATFPPTGWVLQNADNGAVAWGTAGAKTLVRRPAAGNAGSANGSAAINCFEYNTDTTQVDNLLSVPVNLVGAGNPRMTFKRSYKYYNEATAPTNFHDELRVYVSTDCGATFGSSVYFKKGVQLATNGTINTTFTPAVAADWDTDTISLNAYVGQSVIVKFEVTNRYGQNLYIDDINITSTAAAPVANFTSAVTKCAGQPVAFTDASTNTPTSWSWSTTPATGVTITSATSQNPTITFPTAGTYTVSHTATNAVGTSPSFTQAVTVNATPAMTSAATANVCSGAAVGIALTASTGSNYSWIATANANVTGESTTAQTTTTINNTLTISSGTTPQTVTYSVTPTATTGGCVGTAQTVTVTVIPLPTVTNATTASGCSGSALNIPLTASAASSFSWIGNNNGSTNGESTTAQTTSTINNTVTITAGTTSQNITYSITPTSTTGSCVGPMQTMTVTINRLPTMSSANTATVCSGVALNIALTSTLTSTYSWIAADNANTIGESTTAQTSATLNNTINSTATTNQTVNYSVTPTSAAGCVGTVQTVTVTVRPAPNMTSASSASICSGTAVNIPLTSSIAANYSWIATANANTSGESTTAQTTATINNTLAVTVGTAAQTVTYSVTPTSTAAGSCVGPVQTINVTVTPAPTMTSVNTATVCSGSALSIPLASSVPSSYSWIAANNANTAGESTTAQTATTISNTITITGSGNQTVTYSVTPTSTAGSCLGTLQTITVTVRALPTVTATSVPVSGAVCTGSQITLSGGGATTYTWTGGVSNGTAFTPASSVTYTVTGTDVNGCINTATQVVTLNSLPTVTATSVPASGAVCAGSQITLSGGGATTYTWTGGVTNGTAFTPASSVTYTVTGTDGNGCTNTATKVVTINSLPNVGVNSPSTCSGSPVALIATGASTYTWSTTGTGSSISVSPVSNTSYTVTGTDANGCVNTAVSNVTITSAPNVIANSVTICEGQSATITGSGASTYSWSNGDATASSTVSPTTTTSYTVTGSNGPGCSNTAIAMVTVNSLPDASIGTPSTIDCINTSVTLTGSSTAPGASYQWTSGPATAAYAVSAAGSYTLIVTDANGCSASATTNVTSNTAQPDVNIAAPAQLSCITTTVTLTGSSSTPGASYQWTSGPATATYDVSAAGSYTLTVTDPVNGCSSTDIATVTTNTTVVNVTANSSTATTVCGGTAVTLTAGGANTYVWDDASTNAINTVSPTTTTTYSVTGTDVNGCIGTASVTVNVFAPNVPTVSQTGTTLTASSAVSYQWYFNGNPMPGETNQTLNVTQNGTYTVETVDVNGCTNTSTGFTVANIGIKDVTMNASITIYPNPNNGSFEVKGNVDSKSEYTLELRNMLGQLIQLETIKNTSSFNRAFSMETNDAGVYFIIIRNTEGASSVHRVIVE
jgi:PKD repeat protein